MLDRSEVRQAVRDRVQQTPGVIASKGQDVHASLNIQLTLVDGYNAAVLRHAQGLLDGVKPNGDVITDEDLSTQWRVTRTLTSGFWYEWDPEPPLGWREARSALTPPGPSSHVEGSGSFVPSIPARSFPTDFAAARPKLARAKSS